MNIAILSDIHDHVWNLRAALHWLAALDADRAPDTLICCGDLCSPFIVDLLVQPFADRELSIHVVLGNNDGDATRITSKARDLEVSRLKGGTQQTPVVLVHPEIAELVEDEGRLLTRQEFERQQGTDSFLNSRQGGIRIAVQHFNDIALPLAASDRYDLVCYGHNHAYAATRHGRALALNPGTLMAWSPLQKGNAVPATFALYDTRATAPPCHQFFRVEAPWQSTDQPGSVRPLEPTGS